MTAWKLFAGLALLAAVWGTTIMFPISSCKFGQDALMAPTVSSYCGPNMKTPSVEIGKLYIATLQPGRHHIHFRPWLHNPTGMVLSTKRMWCEYSSGGIVFGASHEVRDVSVPARSSRQLQGFDFVFDTDDATPVSGVTCLVDYGAGFPVYGDYR